MALNRNRCHEHDFIVTFERFHNKSWYQSLHELGMNWDHLLPEFHGQIAYNFLNGMLTRLETTSPVEDIVVNTKPRNRKNFYNRGKNQRH